MLKKALIAAMVAAFIPAVAHAAPKFDRHNPAPITITQKAPAKFISHKHGPKIVYKTIFQTKKVVKIEKVRGRYVKVVRWVKVPVRVAFINGKPLYRL